MATINLLPWRDEYRQEKKREFFSVLGLSVVLAGLICYVWVSFVSAAIDQQKYRNNLLNKEIVQLNAKVKEIELLKTKRTDLESKTEVIQGLQSKRPLVVRYFDELVRVLPDGVYLTKLSLKDSTYSLSGVSESNNRISTLMRNFDNSVYFSSPNLKNVIEDKFDLTVNVVVPELINDQLTR